MSVGAVCLGVQPAPELVVCGFVCARHLADTFVSKRRCAVDLVNHNDAICTFD